MRRAIWMVVVLLALAGKAGAAGSCASSGLERAILNGTGTDMIMASVSCTADAADGSIPDVTLQSVGGYLVAVCVDMGATPPTSETYDIYVKADAIADIDLLGGNGVNLTTTADLCFPPKHGGVFLSAPFAGSLTVSQSGNAVNSATPTIYLLFDK